MENTAGPGHNSGIAGNQLKSVIERIERLTEEKKALQEDIKEVFAEAKGNGFDPAIIRLVLRARAMDAEKRQEQDALFEAYFSAIGMI